MADPQDRPEDEASAVPPATPAKKAPGKKAPAKKAPAKKAAAKKAPAKKAPAKKAPAKKSGPRPPQPALESAPPHAALTVGSNNGTRSPAAAKPSGPGTGDLLAPQTSRHRIPLSIALAAAGLVALVISRFRRG